MDDHEGPAVPGRPLHRPPTAEQAAASPQGSWAPGPISLASPAAQLPTASGLLPWHTSS